MGYKEVRYTGAVGRSGEVLADLQIVGVEAAGDDLISHTVFPA
jgi:hypothetical protein